MPLYAEIREKISRNDMEGLKEQVNKADPIDICHIIARLRPQEMIILFRLLNKGLAMEVFEQLDVDLQEQLLASFTDERANEFFANLDPDDRARLLDELPARVAKKLLASLSPAEREMTADLLGYPPETAGRIMNPKYVRLRAEVSVAEALEKLRHSKADEDVIYTLYVTDDQRRLQGIITLPRLVMAEKDQKVHQVMDTNVVSVVTSTDQEVVARLLHDRDLLAVPVVDGENRLVGVVTIDDALDILEEETTEDIFDKAGLASLSQQESGRSKRLLHGTLWEIWQVRLPFLFVTLVGGFLAGGVIESFEETLTTITAVSVFIPIIMDMGGNTGTQSSTIFARAFVLGDLDASNFWRHWLKEVGVGLSMGIVLGLITGFFAELWQTTPGIGWAVGAALATTTTLAAGLGFIVPYVLNRFGLDQAAGADPIITTIKDISGLIIYFYFVHLFITSFN
ncbi:MAG: magnesium transporter [Limnochordia bacterium]|jgi:magnesium transporter